MSSFLRAHDQSDQYATTVHDYCLPPREVIFQPQVMSQEDLDAGRLARLFTDWPAPTWPIHLAHLPDANIPPKLGSFIAFLQETMGHGGGLRGEPAIQELVTAA